jgi:CHAT domain-containing protein
MEKTPGLSTLRFAKQEVEELGKILASMSPIKLERPTRAEVLDELGSCKVFHFAGHGTSHPTDPSMSSLLVTDWKQNPLTVKDLVAKKLHQSPPFLAYLSACSTGDNKVAQLLDEGIHLMGACQLAGFQHVIGSLWPVSDSHCVDTAMVVYNGILQAGMSDESVARSLHRAAIKLRGAPHNIPDDPKDPAGDPKDPADDRSIVETTRDAIPEGSQVRPKDTILDPRIWAAYIHIGL